MKIITLFLLIHFVLLADIITPIVDKKSFDKDKVALGKELFFDSSFSKDKKISCASCHSDFGSDKRDISIGSDGRKGKIQSLSIFNAVNNYKQFWNGRAKNLYEQIDGPIHSNFEMNMNKESIEAYLNSSKNYIKRFKKIYNKKPNYNIFKDAIVAFEETLLTPNSKFDQFLRGEIILNKKELKGYKLFQSLGCSTCHNGVNIGGNSMQLFGNVIKYQYKKGQPDLYDLTKVISDKNVFRVPSLRNVSKTAPYFHDASANNLEAAVEKMSYHNLGIILSGAQTSAIVSFLKTLNGDIPKTWIKDAK